MPRVSSLRHLDIQLTFNLDWKEQVSIMSLKASRKLSVLRRVKNLQKSTLDILYKTTARSVIDFGWFIYYNSLNQTDIKKSIKFNILLQNYLKPVQNPLNVNLTVKS